MLIRLENMLEFNSFFKVLEGYYDSLCKYNTKLVLTSKNPYYDLSIKALKPKDDSKVVEICATIITEHLLQSLFAKYYAEANIKTSDCRLEAEAQKDFMSLLQISSEKTKLQNLLRVFLSTEEMIFDTKGFRDFRLTYLKPLVKKSILNATAFIEEKQEYGHLVASLQTFIQNQKSVTPTLNIILFEGGSFALKDEQGFIIREQEIVQELEIAKELGCGYDDSLVTAVVSLAPKQIIIHQSSEKPLKISPLIYDILPDAISYCQGCRLCQKQLQNL